MPAIQIPGWVSTLLQLLMAFGGAFALALWLSMIVWTFRDVRSRSRDPFAILLAAAMTVIFGPLGLLLYFLLRPQVTLAELYERSLEEEALLQDLEERPRCPGCSRAVEKDWIVCPDCHTQLKRVCTNCSYKLHLRWNICPSCGHAVNQSMPLSFSQPQWQAESPAQADSAGGPFSQPTVEAPYVDASPERDSPGGTQTVDAA